MAQWLIGFAPDSELALDSIGHLLEFLEVNVMQAFATGKFPDALNGVEFRTIRGQVVELEVFGIQRPPVLVKFFHDGTERYPVRPPHVVVNDKRSALVA